MKSNQYSILVTGASTGIGRELAISFAEQTKYFVYAAVRKEVDAIKLRSLNISNLHPILLDVTSEESVASAIEKVSSNNKWPLIALVNNAGIAHAAPMEFVPISAVKDIFEVNVYGLLRVTQACVPLLRVTKGRIINIGSIAGKITTPLMGAYSASKHAVEALSDALRRELKHWNIQVSIIEPGMVATPIWETSINRSNELMDHLPVDGRKLYENFFKAKLNGIEKNLKMATQPVDVYKAVLDAIESLNPKTRYLVGKDAKIGNLLRRLPDKWFDTLLLK